MKNLTVECFLLENQGKPVEREIEIFPNDFDFIKSNNITVNYEVLRTGEEVWYCSKPSDEDEFMHLVRPLVDECNSVKELLYLYQRQ